MASAPPLIAPMVPLLEYGSFAGHWATKARSLFDLPYRRVTGQGRLGIAQLLQFCGIGSGDGVVLPAYHCLAMTAAVRAVGAHPVLCPIQHDLSMRLDDVLSAAAGQNVKAALIPHLFAWKQSRGLFDQLRKSTTWILIEDCAHSFFSSGAESIGELGDFAIGSLAKFFPIRQGGLIASATRDFDLPLRRQSVRDDLKLFVNGLEESASFEHLGFASSPTRGLLSVVTRFRRSLRPSVSSVEVSPQARQRASDVDIDRGRLPFDGGRLVERLVASSSIRNRMAAGRLELFARLREFFAEAPHALLRGSDCDAEFPPYVFPLVLIEPEQMFAELKRRNVPMYRWEDIEPSECEIARRYSRQIVQLPCHPSLRPSEIDSIVRAVMAVVR